MTALCPPLCHLGQVVKTPLSFRSLEVTGFLLERNKRVDMDLDTNDVSIIVLNKEKLRQRIQWKPGIQAQLCACG